MFKWALMLIGLSRQIYQKPIIRAMKIIRDKMTTEQVYFVLFVWIRILFRSECQLRKSMDF